MMRVFKSSKTVVFLFICIGLFLSGCAKQQNAGTSKASLERETAATKVSGGVAPEKQIDVKVTPTPLVVPSEIPKEGEYVKEDKEKGVKFYFKDGMPIRLERDKDANGKTDIWIYYENGKPSRSEVDRNGDSKPDYWRYMDKDGITQKEEGDQNYDGTLDVWVYYDKGVKTKMEVDKNFDGKIDGIFGYDRMGNLMSAQIDTDFNGSFDKIVSPQAQQAAPEAMQEGAKTNTAAPRVPAETTSQKGTAE